MKTVADLKPNEYGTVLKIDGEKAIRRRIIDMGITTNTTIFMRKAAPFGDPIEITVRGYPLCIRKNEAEKIYLAEVGYAKKQQNQ